MDCMACSQGQTSTLNFLYGNIPVPVSYYQPIMSTLCLLHACFLMQCLLPCMQHGYAVIFLTRKGSIQPFTQSLPQIGLVQLLQATLDAGRHVNQHSSKEEPTPSTSPQLSAQEQAIISTIKAASVAMQQNLLFSIEFETIFEYLEVNAEPWLAFTIHVFDRYGVRCTLHCTVPTDVGHIDIQSQLESCNGACMSLCLRT